MSEGIFEKAKRVIALQACIGRKRQDAVELLGIGSRTLSEWLREYGYEARQEVTDVPRDDLIDVLAFLGITEGEQLVMSTSLIDALSSAGEDDLQEIDERIEQLTKELDSLREAWRIIDRRINGHHRRKPRKVKAHVSTQNGRVVPDESIAEEIYNLINAEGSLPTKIIRERLGLDGRKLAAVIRNCEWFSRNGEGDVCIATAGGDAA